MERLTHERVNGIKTGYWSAATKEVLVQMRRSTSCPSAAVCRRPT